jgi:hypothetical protein
LDIIGRGETFSEHGVGCQPRRQPKKRPVKSKKKLMKFHTSAAAGLKSGQFNRERNFGLVLQINVFILVLKSEYRIMNIECRISKEGILSIFIS